MPNRALETVNGSINCITDLAGELTPATSSQQLDLFARSYSFTNWASLIEFLQGSATLLDKRTAQITRTLRTDLKSAWEFLANPKQLETWMFPAEFEAKPCAPFKFAPAGWYGTIGVFEEGRELRFDAVAGGWTWFSLDSVDGETVFRLRDYIPPNFVVPDEIQRDWRSLDDAQPGGEGTHWQGVLAGWHCGVDTLVDSFIGQKHVWDYDAISRLYRVLIANYHRHR